LFGHTNFSTLDISIHSRLLCDFVAVSPQPIVINPTYKDYEEPFVDDRFAAAIAAAQAHPPSPLQV
jgi:hypothetical protein